MAQYREDETLLQNASRGVDITDPTADLPTDIELDKDDNFRLPDDMIEYINEYLTDTYGYYNGGWAWKLSVHNVDWETEE